MVKLMKKYLPGSSILEPLIALMIILFSLTAAFTVVIQSNRQNNVPQIVRAQELASGNLNQAIFNKMFLNEELLEDGLRIEKLFEWYDHEKSLLTCKINVYDNENKILANRTRIVIYYEDQ